MPREKFATQVDTTILAAVRTLAHNEGRLAEVLAIHDDQIERYGGSSGVCDLGLLEACALPSAGRLLRRSARGSGRPMGKPLGEPSLHRR
jgi:hypothetical protein